MPSPHEHINPSLQRVYHEIGTFLSAFHPLCLLILTTPHEAGITVPSLPICAGECINTLNVSNFKRPPQALMRRH
jgi:hypothetical protein